MWIYNRRPRRSLSNSTPKAAHQGDGKWKSEGKWNSKIFNVGDSFWINWIVNFLEKRTWIWLTEHFKVSRILDTKPIAYRSRDMKDDEILAGFCDYELQEVKNSGMYQIEKIVTTCTHRGKRQLLVRWLRKTQILIRWYLLRRRTQCQMISMWHLCPISLIFSTMIWIKQVIFGQNYPLPPNSTRKSMKLLSSIVFSKTHMISWEKIVHMR